MSNKLKTDSKKNFILMIKLMAVVHVLGLIYFSGKLTDWSFNFYQLDWSSIKILLFVVSGFFVSIAIMYYIFKITKALHPHNQPAYTPWKYVLVFFLLGASLFSILRIIKIDGELLYSSLDVLGVGLLGFAAFAAMFNIRAYLNWELEKISDRDELKILIESKGEEFSKKILGFLLGIIALLLLTTDLSRNVLVVIIIIGMYLEIVIINPVYRTILLRQYNSSENKSSL